jgi:hypothetical protein
MRLLERTGIGLVGLVALAIAGWVVLVLLTPDEGRGDRLLWLFELATVLTSLWLLYRLPVAVLRVG